MEKIEASRADRPRDSDSIAGMRTAALLLLVSTVALPACGGPTPPPFKPVVDTKLLMQSVVDPNADLVWDAVKTIETKDGIQEIRPKTDAEWTAVRNAAVAVAESGNLLMMVPRAKNGGDWMQLAQDMINSGEEAMKAAQARNADKLFTVGGDIYDSCSNCHRKYLDAIVNAYK
jgi:hypothetical protein